MKVHNDDKQMISDDSASHKTERQVVDDEKTRKII
jgi:hypothetical protein